MLQLLNTLNCGKVSKKGRGRERERERERERDVLIFDLFKD